MTFILFVHKSLSHSLQDLNLYRRIDWVGSVRPAAAPRCGFVGEKCVSKFVSSRPTLMLHPN